MSISPLFNFGLPKSKLPGFDNVPKSQVIRPRGNFGSGSGGVTLASDLRTITQAAPSSVPAQDQTTWEAYSDNQGSFDSTTNGKKAIIKFASPVFVRTGDFWFTSLGGYRDINPVNDVYVRFDYTSCSLAQAMTFYMRSRAILDDFDSTTVTWNNMVTAPMVTFGPDVYFKRTQVDIPVSAANFEMDSTPANTWLKVNANASVYGLIVDCRGFWDTGTISGGSIHAKTSGSVGTQLIMPSIFTVNLDW